MPRGWIYQTLLVLLSGFGVFAGARLSLSHLEHGEICPMIGPVPACIIVFLGYGAIFIAALLIRQKKTRKLFALGWTPVFLLALVGVILELVQGQVCPPGAGGIPQCVFSLAMVLICLGLFVGLVKRLNT